MAYNNYFPAGYQPAYLAPGYQNQSQNNGLLWVQGEAGAKSYLVAPNTTVLLMDSEGDKFYLKSTDSSGMPRLRTFEYREVTPRADGTQKGSAGEQEPSYVTKDEFDALKRVVDGLTEVKNDEQSV